MRFSTNVLAAATVAAVVILAASEVHAQGCGDANTDGRLTVTDGVDVLRASAGLSTSCSPSVCDVDGNGTVSVTDGVVVLRAAADLPTTLACNLDARQGCVASIRAGNFAAAEGVCATAASDDPNDPEIQAFAAASSAVVATFATPEITDTLDALGWARSGSAVNVCDVAVRRRQAPAGAPRSGEVAALLRGRGLELIDRVLASMADVPPGSSFEFSCPELAAQEVVVEVDYGDVLVTRYQLQLLAASIHLAAAYDVDFDLAGVLNDDLSLQDLLVGNPSLFVLRGGSGAAELGLARNRLDEALASFIAAVDFLAAEADDQSNDVFVIGFFEAPTIARERAGAVLLRTALNGTARFDASTFDLPGDQRVTLDPFFDGKLSTLRPLVPGFEADGSPDRCAVPDPTFGGILPDLDTDPETGCLDRASLKFFEGAFGPLLLER